MQGFVIFLLLPKNSCAHYLVKPYPSLQQKKTPMLGEANDWIYTNKC